MPLGDTFIEKLCKPIKTCNAHVLKKFGDCSYYNSVDQSTLNCDDYYVEPEEGKYFNCILKGGECTSDIGNNKKLQCFKPEDITNYDNCEI